MNGLLKSSVLSLLPCLLLCLSGNGQAVGIHNPNPAQIADATQADTHSTCYNPAYLEIADMLDGKSSLSVKRAVFLAEWAYLDGQLDYGEYCQRIDSAAIFLNRFIQANGLNRYRTAKNMALTEYFFRPYSGNGHKPFTYDFNDTAGADDFAQQFVTKVMRTHTGQCRSLPFYYKVLAEAIGAEASIAYAPQHVFIRYRDEDDLIPEEWMNVELTTHQLTPEFFYREHFEINEKAIASKVYLHPLSDRETIAAQLSDLAHGYWHKYRIYDRFTLQCVDKSLEYYSQHPNALIIRGNTLQTLLMNHLDRNGNKMDEYAQLLEQELIETSDRLENLGWEPMREGLQERLDKANEQGKSIQETLKNQK